MILCNLETSALCIGSNLWIDEWRMTIEYWRYSILCLLSLLRNARNFDDHSLFYVLWGHQQHGAALTGIDQNLFTFQTGLLNSRCGNNTIYWTKNLTFVNILWYIYFISWEFQVTHNCGCMLILKKGRCFNTSWRTPILSVYFRTLPYLRSVICPIWFQKPGH